MSTDWYETAYALAIDEGMTPEEAHAWAEAQDGPRARSNGGVGSVGLLGESLDETNKPTKPTGGPKGLMAMLDKAESRKEPSFVVDGVLPTGLSVLAGASKIGKSFMALDVAFGVASGEPVLGTMAVDPGEVLYLALEDTSTRLRTRLDSLNPDRGAWPFDTLTIVSMDMVGSQDPRGIASAWAHGADNKRLVIIDTITRFGGYPDRAGYAAEVRWMSQFHEFASHHDIAVLGLTHTNQMKLEEGDDWFNKVSGTTGIIGTADNVMLLDVPRGEQEGMLRIEGRDLDPTEYSVRKVGPWWQTTAQLRGRQGDQSIAIADYVIQMGETDVASVAAHFKMSTDKANVYLGRLVKRGSIVRMKRGVYGPAKS